jgi:hypothetical protein
MDWKNKNTLITGITTFSPKPFLEGLNSTINWYTANFKSLPIIF